MANAPVDKIRGTLDLLPEELRVRQTIGSVLEEEIARFGYQAIELPILEQTELFLRKSGHKMAAKLYSFRHHQRDLCLRPEVTPSVIRAYLAHLQHLSLPLRLAYTGPVFRYEKPQRGRYRQFTEIGVELIGADSLAADAEVIGLAASGLARVGLDDYQLVIGHIGIAQSFLAGLQLDERVRDWLAWSMEDLRQHGDDYLHHALDGILPASEATTGLALEPGLHQAVDEISWESLAPDEAERVLLRLLEGAGLDLTGSRRRPQEIARRLVDRLRRPVRNRDVEVALRFLRRLTQLRGEPGAVLAGLRELLSEEQLPEQPLAQLEALLPLLSAYGVPSERIVLDAGLVRGLHYYTGIIFEIYDQQPDGEYQLAGGGRYDDLTAVLGARERIPACGFAYGLERLVEALQSRQRAPELAVQQPDCLVCAVSPAELAYATRIAQQLRGQGQRVELDIRQRGVRANLEVANRRGIAAVVIVGEQEQRSGTYTWKEMRSGQQETRPAAISTT